MGDDDGGGQREAVVTPREKPPGGWYYSETERAAALRCGEKQWLHPEKSLRVGGTTARQRGRRP